VTKPLTRKLSCSALAARFQSRANGRRCQRPEIFRSWLKANRRHSSAMARSVTRFSAVAASIFRWRHLRFPQPATYRSTESHGPHVASRIWREASEAGAPVSVWGLRRRFNNRLGNSRNDVGRGRMWQKYASRAATAPMAHGRPTRDRSSQPAPDGPIPERLETPGRLKRWAGSLARRFQNDFTQSWRYLQTVENWGQRLLFTGWT